MPSSTASSAVAGSSKTAIMPSPRRLTTSPPCSCTGCSIAHPTSRSNASAASSPASSAQAEKSTRSVKTIASSVVPRPRPCASATCSQTCSAPRPASLSSPGRRPVTSASRRPNSCQARGPPVESGSPNAGSPGSRARAALISRIARGSPSIRRSRSRHTRHEVPAPRCLYLEHLNSWVPEPISWLSPPGSTTVAVTFAGMSTWSWNVPSSWRQALRIGPRTDSNVASA